MDIQNNGYMSIAQLTDQYLGKTQKMPVRETKDGLTFQDVLQRKAQPGDCSLKFSKHAAGRLADRNIRLTDEQMGRLSDGTQKAGAKGIKESLVIVDQLAFIVNIPNRTVVTAMDQAETEENIFTNIDGAVIM